MNAGPCDIATAAARLRAGGLVAFPTETVYGLGADALNPEAIARVYCTKGRPSSNPLIVHVSTLDMARKLTSSWSPQAQALASTFWPGPLTLVLPRSSIVPSIATSGGPNVAIRMPNHPTALALINAFGGPLVGPSANPSGRISPTCADHVRANFCEDDVAVLDGGTCAGGIESTVVSLVSSPKILRQGMIGPREVSRVLGIDVSVDSRHESDPSKILESPGTSAMHYAPRKQAFLVRQATISGFIDKLRDVAVLAINPIEKRPDRVIFRMPADDAGYAARLYEAMHEADSSKCKIIVIEEPPTTGELWQAIHDRLSRATIRPE